MVEKSSARKKALLKRVDNLGPQRSTFGQVGDWWWHVRSRVVTDAQVTMNNVGAVLIGFCWDNACVCTANVKLMSVCAGWESDGRRQNAGQDDIERDGVGRKNCIAQADPSLVSEPRHVSYPCAKNIRGKIETKLTPRIRATKAHG